MNRIHTSSSGQGDVTLNLPDEVPEFANSASLSLTRDWATASGSSNAHAKASSPDSTGFLHQKPYAGCRKYRANYHRSTGTALAEFIIGS